MKIDMRFYVTKSSADCVCFQCKKPIKKGEHKFKTCSTRNYHYKCSGR